MNRRFGFLLIILIILIGCSNNTGSEKQDDSLTIYATLYPLAYFAEEIGGEDVNVKTILPPGADPHNFEPTSRMMVNIAEADIFLFNGVNLETYAEKIEGALAEEDVLIVEASHGISLDRHTHAHEQDTQDHEKELHKERHVDVHEHQHDMDPHIWLDPIRSIGLAENIKEALIESNPEQTENFEENFKHVKERLIKLDKKFHQQLEETTSKDILVTHAAYSYWEQSYGLKQIALAGLSPSEEPSQKQLEKILDYVKQKETKYLLSEQNVEPKVAKVIQEETDIQSLELHNLSVLTEDDIDNKESYFTLMERNLEVLVKALNN